MSKLFCCYSSALKEFLYSQGLRYELCALNPNNRQMFWAYLRTNELDIALNKWASNR